MDGPIRLGHRMLSIEFQNDRHAQQRIELAYRRVEDLKGTKPVPKTTVQIADLVPLTAGTFTLETQG